MSAKSQAVERMNLTGPDLAVFAALKIPPKLLVLAGVCRVTDQEARRFYGIGLKSPPSADMSGIVFPYLNPLTGCRASARVRRDKPELKPDGRPENKYVSAFGDNRHLYFPPGASELLKDATVPVVFVEAEKSALALTAWAQRRSVKLLGVGTGGCSGWQGKEGIYATANGEREEGRGPLPDFGLITWDGREAIVCFDSNVASNPMVQRERGKLARALLGWRARVRIATIPVLEGVNGPDDLIGLHGDNAFGNVFREAEPFNYSKHLPRFFLNEKGVWAVEYGKDGKPDHSWLSSPIRVEAYTRDEQGNNWGRLLQWEDAERRRHVWAMPMELLGGDGTEVYRRLLAQLSQLVGLLVAK